MTFKLKLSPYTRIEPLITAEVLAVVKTSLPDLGGKSATLVLPEGTHVACRLVGPATGGASVPEDYTVYQHLYKVDRYKTRVLPLGKVLPLPKVSTVTVEIIEEYVAEVYAGPFREWPVGHPLVQDVVRSQKFWAHHAIVV